MHLKSFSFENPCKWKTSTPSTGFKRFCMLLISRISFGIRVKRVSHHFESFGQESYKTITPANWLSTWLLSFPERKPTRLGEKGRFLKPRHYSEKNTVIPLICRTFVSTDTKAAQRGKLFFFSPPLVRNPLCCTRCGEMASQWQWIRWEKLRCFLNVSLSSAALFFWRDAMNHVNALFRVGLCVIHHLSLILTPSISFSSFLSVRDPAFPSHSYIYIYFKLHQQAACRPPFVLQFFFSCPRPICSLPL